MVLLYLTVLVNYHPDRLFNNGQVNQALYQVPVIICFFLLVS